MKNATTLLLTLSTLFATYGYCQAVGGYANAAAAASGAASASGSSLGHSVSAATSHNASGVANATANTSKVSGTASAASGTATQVGRTGAAASQATNLSAELTQKINSKNAKVGDEVIARTTSSAQLGEGTRLPKGTRLIGKVTEVDAKSDAQHDGHLAFAFDRAVLRDGREVPIHATLQSISAPAISEMADSSDDFGAGLGAAPIAGGAGGRASGGLLGGGAVAHSTGLVGGATSAVASAPIRVTSTAGSTVYGATGAAAHGAGLTAAAVSNLPGIAASSSTSSSTVLDAKGRNIDLSSGTQMTFAVSAR